MSLQKVKPSAHTKGSDPASDDLSDEKTLKLFFCEKGVVMTSNVNDQIQNRASQDFDLSGAQNRPLAIITGASTGIGYELAKCCAEHGFDLLVAADEPQ